MFTYNHKGEIMTIEANKTNKTEEPKETLNTEERKTLLSCESTIRAGLRSFYNVGRALTVIRTDRLYRASHESFDKYLVSKNRWDMTRQRAQQLIAAYRLHSFLKDLGFTTLPTTESQCRPFSKVPEDIEHDATVARIWQAVIDTNKKVTAKLVDATVNSELGLDKEEPKGESTTTATGESAQADTTGATEEKEAGPDMNTELVRQLKMKIAYLESALAAEKKAHQRTRTASAGTSAPQSKLAKDMYTAGFRAMARQHHPDFGGTDEAMKELNSIKEALAI